MTARPWRPSAWTTCWDASAWSCVRCPRCWERFRPSPGRSSTARAIRNWCWTRRAGRDGPFRRRSAGTSGPARAEPPLLVIDDSLTTRMLEQGILETAGYEVDTAASGEEALQKARQRRYGVFIVDVEMPGMDGFEFIEAARADARLQPGARRSW